MECNKIGNVAFVDRDGSYSGTTELILFDDSDLNDSQWEVLGVLPDYEKMSYVQAILDGEEDLSKWES